MKNKVEYTRELKNKCGYLLPISLITIFIGLVVGEWIVWFWGLIILVICIWLDSNQKNTVYYQVLTQSKQISKEEYDKNVKSAAKSK